MTTLNNISLTDPESDLETLINIGHLIVLMSCEKTLEQALLKLVKDNILRSSIDNYLDINSSFLYVSYNLLDEDKKYYVNTHISNNLKDILKT